MKYFFKYFFCFSHPIKFHLKIIGMPKPLHGIRARNISSSLWINLWRYA